MTIRITFRTAAGSEFVETVETESCIADVAAEVAAEYGDAEIVRIETIRNAWPFDEPVPVRLVCANRLVWNAPAEPTSKIVVLPTENAVALYLRAVRARRVRWNYAATFRDVRGFGISLAVADWVSARGPSNFHINDR